MEELTPSIRLEQIVLAMIPPLARESVAGDLCETYENPRQYVVEALRTVPFVVASQMRRNLNLPALVLQTALAWFLLGGWVAALVTPVLMLRAAYRPLSRPSAAYAIRETIVISLLAMIFVQGLSFDIPAMQSLGIREPGWFSLYVYLLGFAVAPLLCFVRTSVIVGSDHGAPWEPAGRTVAALTEDYCAFARRARWRNFLEVAALTAMMLVLYAETAANPALVMAIVAATGWLATQGAAPIARQKADFPFLRASYKQALRRQQQLRCFLSWLWFAPLLLTLHDGLMRPGLAAGWTVSTLTGAAIMALLCFLATIFNREQGGRMQEAINALDRLSEVAHR